MDPLPFLYLSTGVETRFINLLDPDPKTRAISRNLPHIHRPGTLSEWLRADTLQEWVERLHDEGTGFYTAADGTRPSSLRSRLHTLPDLGARQLFGSCLSNCLVVQRLLEGVAARLRMRVPFSA